MKWNGIVSQLAHRTIAARFAAANATQRRSIGLSRRKPVPDVANGLDRRGPELLPESADAHVHDVRPRIEVVAPHLREQLLPAADLVGMRDEVAQQLKLAVGEIDGVVADSRAAPRKIELERPCTKQPLLLLAEAGCAQLDAHACDQLVERERLGDVVARTELEAA